LFAAILVFPIAAIVPATPSTSRELAQLLTIVPIGCYMCGALGLTFAPGSSRTVPMLFGISCCRSRFRCGVLQLSTLEPVRWVQIACSPTRCVCAKVCAPPPASTWPVAGTGHDWLLGVVHLVEINGFKKGVHLIPLRVAIESRGIVDLCRPQACHVLGVRGSTRVTATI
jgi:hypothetical protein